MTVASIEQIITIGEDGFPVTKVAAGSNKDWGFDLTSWLQDGETVATCTWAATGANSLTITRQQISSSGKVVSCYVAGFQKGESYTVEATFTTTAPSIRTDQQILRFNCNF